MLVGTRMTVAALILDMDGLMVDTEPLYKVAWQQASSEVGFDLNDERYAMIVGRTMAGCERVLVEQFGPTFPVERVRERRPVLWREEVERRGVQPKPGLLELLAFADTHGLHTAVATSTNAETAAFTLGCAGLAGRISTVVTGDQIAHSKPAPDIYLEAARRLGVDPAACIAIEDSEAGVLSIANAGMRGILVPHWPASDLAQRTAYRVVDSLHDACDLIAHLLTEHP